MTKTFESLSTSFTSERNASLDVDHEAPPINFDPSSFLTEIEASSSRFAPVYANTLEQTGVNLEASTSFVDTRDRMGGGSGEQYLDEQIGQEQVAHEQVVREIFASQFDVFNISPSLSDERSLGSMRRICRMSEELEFLAPRYCENRNICFSQMTMAGTFPHPPAPPLADLPFRENLRRIRAKYHRWDDLTYSCICRACDRLDIWDNEYWAAEMRGATPGIPAFNTPSIPIPENLGDFLRADDSSARGSVPGQLNEPKDLGNASRSKGKGKVDLVDKKPEKKRIAAKAEADLEEGRIPAFRIGGTCEVLSSEAPVAHSLGVTPLASLSVSSYSAAVPPCPAVQTAIQTVVQTAVNVPQLPPPSAPLTSSSRPASELSSESSLSKRRRITEDIKIAAEVIKKIGGIEVKFSANLEDLLVPDRFLDWSRDLLNIINSGSHIVGAYEAVVAEKEEQIRSMLAPTDVDAARKELDHQKARGDSWEIVELRASLEKSHLTEDHLRKERDGARRRADDIAGGSFAQNARHSSHLERIRSYLLAFHAQEELKAQLCYRRGARISLEKMVDAEYELPPGLLENYAKEEEEYLAKVESLAADSLGDDILFLTPLPPPVGPPRDVSS
ncbi:hypothetical protein AALP_AA6G174900 [Arabis alpina]|uniref:Uncharacterized protein n=1 Tax=Arabis alpina TaxID=50452 RepID=A0A087GPV9_ARAAL|nr:hypothetical protein AALP_AA6G174900 [Arabis alpina]